MADSMRVDGEVAIVTGGAQGIGKGAALTLAEAGATIVIGDIKDSSDTVEEIRSAGGKAVCMQMDTSRPADAQALVDLSMKEYGHLDILVNNAGIDGPFGTVWDLPDDEWERVIAVNLGGVFYCSRAALGPMMKAKKGAIVNMSSQAARNGSKDISPAYHASKAGILGLTLSFSGQVSHLGIRVNAVLPGLVESWRQWTPEERAALAAQVPLGIGQPRDIGEAIRYLVSPAARWVSGVTIDLHGGWNLK